MSGLFTAIFVALVTGLIMHLATWSTVNSNWKTDCEKIGYHVEGSVEQKVYKCELKR